MRHRKNTFKLGRTSSHREALLASLVSSLITNKRITTTVRKAKQAGSMAEKMVSLAREGSLASRRRAVSKLRNVEAVKALFEDIVPKLGERAGGCTRVVRLGRRTGDGAELALLEWVDMAAPIAGRKKKAETKETE